MGETGDRWGLPPLTPGGKGAGRGGSAALAEGGVGGELCDCAEPGRIADWGLA